jgi:hypothetical protein
MREQLIARFDAQERVEQTVVTPTASDTESSSISAA